MSDEVNQEIDQEHSSPDDCLYHMKVIHNSMDGIEEGDQIECCCGTEWVYKGLDEGGNHDFILLASPPPIDERMAALMSMVTQARGLISDARATQADPFMNPAFINAATFLVKRIFQVVVIAFVIGVLSGRGLRRR